MHSRLQHILFGALAGLFYWALQEGDLVTGPLGLRGVFAITVAGMVFFGTGLAMLGEIGARKAGFAAVLIAIPTTVLGWWSAGAFDPAQDLLGQMDFGVLALFVLATVPMPFAMVIAQQGRGAWADYPALFTHTWNIVVRYGAAWLFLALVWLLLYLSSQLLQSVGIDWLRQLFRLDWLALGLSGAVLGLGLAVVTELEEMISPFLLLRLLRLLLPVVMVVVIVFLLGLMLNAGAIDAVGFSHATTLIVISIAAITLVSVAVEREDFEAVAAPILRISTLGLALILPVLAAVSAWSAWLTVAELGWTPARVAQWTLIILIAGYGIGYAASVLRGHGWMARVRRVNIAMALGLLALAVAWLTPLINANAIATKSQIARYEGGLTEPARLPLYAMAQSWGKPGQDGIATLRAHAANDPALAKALASVRVDGEVVPPTSSDARLADLRAQIAQPSGAAPIPNALLQVIERESNVPLSDLCAPRASAKPTCALVMADLRPDLAGDEAVMVRDDGSYTPMRFYYLSNGQWVNGGAMRAVSGGDGAIGLVIAAIAKGQFEIVPSGISGVQAGGQILVPSLR
ncbi:DUF4153 domain-containing protein [Thioclava indica]|uniref:DUF4153 domain-containing protein n=1 Tax=Thioclava indica TaxID=1353528 RepID=A0A074JYD1_9RHOB|nr:DUF4153 domain-containing protein [Thioclava indica]KEO60905.1 hypothetical protein DT23_11850 [Thioclava indica]